jgi:hypothetical protein
MGLGVACLGASSVKTEYVTETGTVEVMDMEANTLSAKAMDHGDKRLVVECCHQMKPMPDMTFEGRAFLSMGGVNLKIWRIGTHRMFGVMNCSPVPDSLMKRLKPGVEVYGVFTVRPLEEDVKGHMRMVCLRSVKIKAVKTYVDGAE